MLKPILKPQDSFDWLSPDDFLAQALAAYYGASCEMSPPDGEPFIDAETGLAWSDRADYLEALTRHLDQRLQLLFEERVIHKSTAVCAEGVPAFLRAVTNEGRCGPCG